MPLKLVLDFLTFGEVSDDTTIKKLGVTVQKLLKVAEMGTIDFVLTNRF